VNYSSESGEEPHPILEYDTKSHETRALFERGAEVRALDFDASGDHLLYTTAQHVLLRYDGEQAIPVATGITGAVW
jgi:hypothetical protein